MYIRTKDGVYDLENDDIVKIDGKYKKCYVQKDTGDTCFKDIEVINVSENLEELCDEFIDIIPRENGKAYHDHWEWSVEEKRFNNDIGESVPFDYFSDNTYFRGAIWTSKGLIYVAKMNENGELELI